ncbi:MULTISPECIES: hypothetical protein [Nostocales]|uniref:Uncharacterized protein n=3 Tax=Nostocales TaxID=1161 RepID=A0A0C1QX72_9CYAN|nr:hypothetical protein [Tolypothrix bouteillei]KAF3885976.1 hypothetical protein DA73_0400011215 [Tolypothrix bouteillei VB521301]
MNTEDRARELMAQQRHHEENLQDAMRNRTEAEVHDFPAETATQEEARELLAQQRHYEEHLQETMRNRAES